MKLNIGLYALAVVCYSQVALCAPKPLSVAARATHDEPFPPASVRSIDTSSNDPNLVKRSLLDAIDDAAASLLLRSKVAAHQVDQVLESRTAGEVDAPGHYRGPLNDFVGRSSQTTGEDVQVAKRDPMPFYGAGMEKTREFWNAGTHYNKNGPGRKQPVRISDYDTKSYGKRESMDADQEHMKKRSSGKRSLTVVDVVAEQDGPIEKKNAAADVVSNFEVERRSPRLYEYHSGKPEHKNAHKRDLLGESEQMAKREPLPYGMGGGVEHKGNLAYGEAGTTGPPHRRTSQDDEFVKREPMPFGTRDPHRGGEAGSFKPPHTKRELVTVDQDIQLTRREPMPFGTHDPHRGSQAGDFRPSPPKRELVAVDQDIQLARRDPIIAVGGKGGSVNFPPKRGLDSFESSADQDGQLAKRFGNVVERSSAGNKESSDKGSHHGGVGASHPHKRSSTEEIERIIKRGLSKVGVAVDAVQQIVKRIPMPYTLHGTAEDAKRAYAFYGHAKAGHHPWKNGIPTEGHHPVGGHHIHWKREVEGGKLSWSKDN